MPGMPGTCLCTTSSCGTKAADLRPAMSLEDVDGAEFEHVSAAVRPGVKAVSLRDVANFTAESCTGVPDSGRPGTP
jgi:hypothetical protein